MKRLILLFLLISSFIQAQDVHFSQMYTAPLYTNPAKTGFFNGSYRYTSVYRNQWASVTVPYSTISASVDINFTSSDNNLLGIGLLTYSDKAGDSKFTTNSFDLSISYAKCLDRYKKAYLNFGLQTGYTESYINYSALTFEQNYNGGVLTEQFATNVYGYFDLNYGVEAYYLIDKDRSFEIGFSEFHLNHPIQTFLNDITASIPQKYIVNIGASFPIKGTILYPKVLFENQYPHRELLFGALSQISSEKSNNVTKTFYAGVLYRWNDAIILVSKLDRNQWSFHASYDINYSSLSKASHFLGGPEIAIQYIGKFEHKRPHKIYCPAL